MMVISFIMEMRMMMDMMTMVVKGNDCDVIETSCPQVTREATCAKHAKKQVFWKKAMPCPQCDQVYLFYLYTYIVHCTIIISHVLRSSKVPASSRTTCTWSTGAGLSKLATYVEKLSFKASS